MTRPELRNIKTLGYKFEYTWEVIDIFEKKIAEYFNAPYAIAIDSCTHALELCLRYINNKTQICKIPLHTYMSVPMMLSKIDQQWKFSDIRWNEYYQLYPFDIYDAAVLWKPDSYIKKSFMCLSFQFKKHLPIGKGGMILTDDEYAYHILQKMCRDGRNLKLLQHEDNIETIGYHYHMTPEDAARGILLFDKMHNYDTKLWSWQDYKNLTEYKLFRQ
jgi:dTDP-4-amino-4,6-dideoxygalactose transaminase